MKKWTVLFLWTSLPYTHNQSCYSHLLTLGVGIHFLLNKSKFLYHHPALRPFALWLQASFPALAPTTKLNDTLSQLHILLWTHSCSVYMSSQVQQILFQIYHNCSSTPKNPTRSPRSQEGLRKKRPFSTSQLYHFPPGNQRSAIFIMQ